MQAIEFGTDGTIGVVSRADPPLPAGHVRVAVAASGLCHTDIAVLRGDYGTGALPLIPGHEFTGIVTEAAPDVTDPAPGTRVVIDPNLPCGACRACLRGDGNLCPDLRAYGVTSDGGFAHQAIVAAAHALDRKSVV